MAENYISSIRVGSTLYNVKDTEARTRLEALDALVQSGVQIVIAESLPTASADTMGKIYFIPHTHEGSNDIYDEYLTFNAGSEGEPNYKWEKIGNTDIDLSDYSKKTHTHAVVPNVTITGASYTPAGNVTLPSFSSSYSGTNAAVATVTSAGTGYTITNGTASAGNDTKASFAKSGMEASVSGETLTFTAANTDSAVTASGAINYTAPVLSGALPTFTNVEVLKSVTISTVKDGNASFAGTPATITPTINNGSAISTAANG